MSSENKSVKSVKLQVLEMESGEIEIVKGPQDLKFFQDIIGSKHVCAFPLKGDCFKKNMVVVHKNEDFHYNDYEDEGGNVNFQTHFPECDERYSEGRPFGFYGNVVILHLSALPNDVLFLDPQNYLNYDVEEYMYVEKEKD